MSRFLFLQTEMCADGLSSYHANQMSGVYVSCLAPISLAKAASPVGGSWNAKIISIAEEKQPVGMFPLGCLEWINLSNCLSSVDILYTHTHTQSQEHTHKQAGKQIHTNKTFAHMYHPHFYMVCWSARSCYFICIFLYYSSEKKPEILTFL